MTQTARRLLAVIDIGASAIRMDIAEVAADGRLRLLDSLKKGIQLGTDVFTGGSLSEESIRAASGVLQDFKKVMDSYGIERYRAVATSAVREASNADGFLDRVLMSTGLDVEIIDGPEENRLTLQAVLGFLKEGLSLEPGLTALVEVGGGSADVTLLDDQEPVQSGTFPLGAIRLRAGVNMEAGGYDKQVRLLTRQISSIVTTVRRAISLKDAHNFLAVGGDIRFAARVLAGEQADAGPHAIPRDEFEAFVGQISQLSPDKLVAKYNLSYLDAETLVPALLTYLLLLKQTAARRVIVTNANIRAGILQDLTPFEEGERLTKLTHQIISAARNVGRKYQYDETHAERVKGLAELIFDELKSEQRLDGTHRLYLQIAALLHDIGLFVSSRGHHKHSHYLISQSDIFGLRPREREIVAQIARYHRRALPQRTHIPYISLDRDDRMLVSKLAAILRVANSLDKEHLQKLTDMKVSREGDQVVLATSCGADLTMERMALAARSDLFREVFGRKVILRETAQTP